MHRFVQHGLMMFTWNANPTPYEQAFEAIKAGIDSLPPGVKMFLNSGTGSTGYIQEPNKSTDCSVRDLHTPGEFYAKDLGPANLDLLAAFFEKYPDYADKTFLSVKVT